MFKAMITASAFTLAVVSGAYAQSSTGMMQNDTTVKTPSMNSSNNNNPGSAKDRADIDTGTTGSVDGNHATGGGADGDHSSCNATETGKNTDVNPTAGSNAKTTNC